MNEKWKPLGKFALVSEKNIKDAKGISQQMAAEKAIGQTFVRNPCRKFPLWHIKTAKHLDNLSMYVLRHEYAIIENMMVAIF